MLFQTRVAAGGSPRPARWGVDSEYGVLRDVLMGPSENFAWRISNAVAARTARLDLAFDREVALAQHRELEQAFEEAGATIHKLGPDVTLPYQVFARDSSVMTPWGAIVMQLQTPFRRGEHLECLRFYAGRDIPVFDVVTAGGAEGGDLMILKPGVAICGLSGDRSTASAVSQIKGWFEAEGWEFRTYVFDPHFLHLDVQISMAAPGLALACKDAVEPELIDWFAARGIRVLDVPYREAMTLGCNVVALGEDRVLVAKENRLVAELCRAEGLTVIPPDVSMFAAAGGGIHCLCQPLRRDSAA